MAIIRWQPPTWPNVWDDQNLDFDLDTGMEVYETDNDVVVKAPVPGLSEDQVKVTFEDGVLRISGQLEETDEEKKKKKIVHSEYRYSSFNYTTTLPRSVDANKLKAELVNGVLVVTAPIAPESKPKQITVTTK